MTYIPGTGSPTPRNNPIGKENIKPSSPEILSVVNVNELKNPTSKEYKEEDELWYNQLKYWLIFGGCGSAFFAILAIINYRFLFLLPLGPYVAYMAWHLKKWVRKYAKKFDSLS